MFQKLANSEGVGLQIEKILDNFTWNDPLIYWHSSRTSFKKIYSYANFSAIFGPNLGGGGGTQQMVVLSKVLLLQSWSPATCEPAFTAKRYMRHHLHKQLKDFEG